MYFLEDCLRAPCMCFDVGFVDVGFDLSMDWIFFLSELLWYYLSFLYMQCSVRYKTIRGAWLQFQNLNYWNLYSGCFHIHFKVGLPHWILLGHVEICIDVSKRILGLIVHNYPRYFWVLKVWSVPLPDSKLNLLPQIEYLDFTSSWELCSYWKIELFVLELKSNSQTVLLKMQSATPHIISCHVTS
jgi:hypothetical protein